MAICTTFFLCKPDELAAGFPTWKPPLTEPVLRRVANPITGGFFELPSLAPEWPDQPEISLIPIAPSLDFGLASDEASESRLPAVVRNHPHWTAAVSIGAFNLERLSDVVGAPAQLECPLHAPPSCREMLVEIPATFLAKFKSLGPANLTGVAEKWAEALKAPDCIEPVQGEPEEEAWSAEFALTVLEPVVRLAQRAAEENMYLYLTAEA